ncbi:MAG TPA: molybdopterin-dependent oxidoreductase [Acidimicrobiia bacterium]|nr:molybdopterin-dependent oxidoreductase [Acidimicrobiia bacterium]
MAVPTDTLMHIRTCPLCEATCGLEITHANGEVLRIRGDRDDVFSHGYICPKGSTLGKLDQDPDRLRTPMIRRNGRHEPATWDEAFELIEERLQPIISAHGPNAVGVYLGNPNVHSMSGVLYVKPLLKMLPTRSIFSAATVDQMPKHVSSGYMFGHPDLIPVPDLDRTSYLLMLGANPYESNGSLATAPDWPGRLEAIGSRGGKVVVVDPRLSRTAKAAQEHIPVRPGTDALFLFSLAQVLFDEGLIDLGHLEGSVSGLDELGDVVAPFTPEAVEAACGVPAGTTRRIARELASAESAAVYSRIGTHTARFGTMSSWMVDALNVITGNLDRPGGAMFSRPAHEQRRNRRQFATGRWTTRVRSLPEVRGELPVSALAEEILEPGEGQIRAMITIAGNPILSTPDSARLDDAFACLDFMVSLDIYLNETTRHADVILPGTTPLRRPHYDFAFYGLSVRNIANYSPAMYDLPEGTPDEWEILLRLGATAGGQGHDSDVDALDDAIFAMAVGSAVTDPSSRISGREPEEIFALTTGGRGPVRMLDFLVRTGPYGDGYGDDADGLTLEKLKESPHGVDLGPLQPRLPGDLCTPSGKVELAPQALLADVPRLEAAIEATPNGGFVLIGRRDVRSNNSWMHNVDVLVKGRERCTLQMNPADAARIGADGKVKISSSAGTLVAPVEVTDDIMPGVVSLPHGWGHDLDGSSLSVAATRPGVNSNLLSTGDMDPISGNAVLNGIPVEVVPA